MEVPPSPKVHDHAVGLPEDVSVKLTASGAAPMVGVPVKAAVGGDPCEVVMVISATLMDMLREPLVVSQSHSAIIRLLSAQK